MCSADPLQYRRTSGRIVRVIEFDGDSDISETTPLSERLDETAAGLELALLLASVDRSRMSCGELLRLAAARQRQVAHQEAQMLADLHAITRTAPEDDDQPPLGDVDPRDETFTWAETESAMALRWTKGRAVAQMRLADTVIDRLPQLFTALDGGRIDIPKALVITRLLECVDDSLAMALVDKVIDKASEWTSAELRARLRRLLLAADPDAVAAKSKSGIKERRVEAYGDDETHLAHLAGHQLAPHRVAAVTERLDAAAKAAKAAGDPRTMDQIRADIFLDLLTGEGISAGGPITDGAIGLDDADDPGTTDPQHAEADAAAAQAARTPWPAEPPEDRTGADPADDLPEPPLPDDPEPVRWDERFGMGTPVHDDGIDPAEVDLSPAERERWLRIFDSLPTARPATWCLLCGHTTGTPTGPVAMPGPRRGVVELVATLDTVMGLADLPAELNGLGAVPADIARQIISQMNDAQWRFSIYDPMTRLYHHGTTNTRPGRGEHQTRRRPTLTQTAWVRARDRTCVAPGCRRTARRCDVDHTLDWVRSGETVHCNLALLCRGHHLFKHATCSELVQSTPGVFHWRTPAGLQYRTRSEPPLLLDRNQLTGVPKPFNPDARLVDANHSLEDWNQPSWLGAEPWLLSPDDIDHLPIPGG
jgi:hypothetical protein